MNKHSGWYAGVAKAMTGRMSAYFQAGALSRSVRFEDELRGALEDQGFTVHRVDWDSAAQHGWDHAYPPTAELGPGSVVLLWHPESVAHRSDFEAVLRQSRPKGQEAIAAGARLVIVSSRPKLLFPEPDGSSIITDCGRLRPVSISSERLQSMRPDLKPEAAERIVRFAGGTVALAESYLELEITELPSNEKRRRADQFLHSVLLRAVDELGVSLLALMDHLVLECDTLDLPENDLADHQIAALESACLLRVDDVDGTVHLFAEPWRPKIKECLSAALRSVVLPPADWEIVARKLFTFERTVRKIVTEALREIHGDHWRKALGDRGTKALGLARNDTNVSASSLDELYAPLDWFLLEDLLELAVEVATANDTIRGIRPSDWARFKVQMVPIRNRVAHMRLPLETDAATARSALLNLDARMRTSERMTVT